MPLAASLSSLDGAASTLSSWPPDFSIATGKLPKPDELDRAFFLKYFGKTFPKLTGASKTKDLPRPGFLAEVGCFGKKGNDGVNTRRSPELYLIPRLDPGKCPPSKRYGSVMEIRDEVTSKGAITTSPAGGKMLDDEESTTTTEEEVREKTEAAKHFRKTVLNLAAGHENDTRVFGYCNMESWQKTDREKFMSAHQMCFGQDRPRTGEEGGVAEGEAAVVAGGGEKKKLPTEEETAEQLPGSRTSDQQEVLDDLKASLKERDCFAAVAECDAKRNFKSFYLREEPGPAAAAASVAGKAGRGTGGQKSSSGDVGAAATTTEGRQDEPASGAQEPASSTDKNASAEDKTSSSSTASATIEDHHKQDEKDDKEVENNNKPFFRTARRYVEPYPSFLPAKDGFQYKPKFDLRSFFPPSQGYEFVVDRTTGKKYKLGNIDAASGQAAIHEQVKASKQSADESGEKGQNTTVDEQLPETPGSKAAGAAVAKTTPADTSIALPGVDKEHTENAEKDLSEEMFAFSKPTKIEKAAEAEEEKQMELAEKEQETVKKPTYVFTIDQTVNSNPEQTTHVFFGVRRDKPETELPEAWRACADCADDGVSGDANEITSCAPCQSVSDKVKQVWPPAESNSGAVTATTTPAAQEPLDKGGHPVTKKKKIHWKEIAFEQTFNTTKEDQEEGTGGAGTLKVLCHGSNLGSSCDDDMLNEATGGLGDAAAEATETGTAEEEAFAEQGPPTGAE